MTVHPLEGGQVAAAGGPGGPCQPHTVQQLTGEKERGGERERVGRVEGKQRGTENSKKLKEKSQNKGKLNQRVLCPSLSELYPLP